MAAIKMEELERLEKEYGLEAGDLTYQLRCSRITALQKGETWESPQNEPVKRGTIESDQSQKTSRPLETHPLYGKRILITPLMTPDKNRNIYYEENVGTHIEVEEVNAGALLYGAGDDVDRMAGDYKVIRTDPNKTITAKTTLPKIGQEISWDIGKELCPVVRGNDQQRGYVWILPTHMRQYGETMIQIYGLKTLITQVAPELLPKFAGKPMMMWVDGLVLAASIPQTEALLKEFRRKEMQDARLGLV